MLASGYEQLDMGHLGPISIVAVSPDGTLLATTGQDRELLLWDLDTGQFLRRASIGEWNEYGVGFSRGLVFSPDSRTIAVDVDGSLELWDVAAWKRRKRIRRVGPPFTFVGNDRLLALQWHEFVLLDLNTGRRLRKLAFGKPDKWYCATYSATGNVAVTAEDCHISPNDPQVIRLWDLATWSERLTRKVPKSLMWRGWAFDRNWSERFKPGDAQELALSPDGSVLAATGEHIAYLCRTDTGRVTRVLSLDHWATPRHLLFSPDGHYIAVAGDGVGGDTVWVHSVASGELVSRITLGKTLTNALTFDPSSRVLITAGSEKVVRLWDAASGEFIRKLRAMEYEATSVCWLNRGSHVAVGYSDGFIRVWDRVTGQMEAAYSSGCGAPIQLIPVQPETLSSHSICENSSIVETGHGSLLSLGALPATDDDMEGMRHLSRDVSLLAVVPATPWVMGREMEIRDSAGQEGPIALRLSEHVWPSCLCFSPDKSTFAAGSSYKGVFLYDARTGEPKPGRGEMGDGRGNTTPWFYTLGSVTAVAFAPDGRNLLAGSDEGNLWIWDTTLDPPTDWSKNPSGVDITLRGHSDAIRSIDFSPDGQWMATASDDASVKIWRVSDWQLQMTLIVLPDEENQPSERTLALRSSVETSI